MGSDRPEVELATDYFRWRFFRMNFRGNGNIREKTAALSVAGRVRLNAKYPSLAKVAATS
jgi:hypothetical protein